MKHPRHLCLALLLLLQMPMAARAQMALEASGDAFQVPVRTYRDIPFRTVIRQQYDYSCGSAALATLLNFHYDHKAGEAEIFKAMYLAGDQATIRKVGFSLLDMKKYIESIGMEADGYRTTLADVARAGQPVITVITVGQYRHFVAIKGISDTTVLIGDPALGLRRLPRAGFEKIWNSIVFTIHSHAAEKIVFNAADEWRPWAQAPSGQEMDRDALLQMNVNVPVIYQVLQLTPMSPNP